MTTKTHNTKLELRLATSRQIRTNLRIYDTLTREKKPFKPRGKTVHMFVCGPTVYDYIHIGNARSYVAFDIVARYLKYKGYKLNYLQNITDIDDKIIQKANDENKTSNQIASRYTKAYLEDVKKLNITSVNKYAPATKYMKQIIDQIKRLEKKGFAYVISDGVYFDISKFTDYGKLSKQNLEELKERRIEPNPEKKNRGDFSLWKFQKPGEPAWDSPWGEGRPGWHIEDTAITETELGPQYDIHGGGEDLIFPHHDCEIAQIEAVSGKKPLVNYWMHNGWLKVEGKKMSKSLRNFITARDAIDKWSAPALRLLFMSAHYKIPMNFTEKSVEQAKSNYEKLVEFVRRLKSYKGEGSKDLGLYIKNRFYIPFHLNMDDDFNISGALGVIFSFVSRINSLIDQNAISKPEAKKALKVILDVDKILGLELDKIKVEEKLSKDLTALIQKREQARNNKDWALADKIRTELNEKGIILEDSDTGPIWKVIK